MEIEATDRVLLLSVFSVGIGVTGSEFLGGPEVELLKREAADPWRKIGGSSQLYAAFIEIAFREYKLR